MASNTLKAEAIAHKLDKLANEARDLYLDRIVPQLESPPTPLQFYRDYVAPNKPVVINHAIDRWPALDRWTNQYLRDKLGEREVTVAVTPNGYADAVTDGQFVIPEQRQMTMADFLDIIEEPSSSKGVFYIQKQNSNLTDEFSAIIGDVEQEIGWGSEAFGKVPDAVNFWMGDERAITSTHRDHYENLYCVIRGWKKFILLPPTDLPYVPYEIYKTGVFRETEAGKFVIDPDEETGQVPWVAVDVLDPDLDKYPQYKKAKPVEVTICAGQMLYLPSLWFHHVRQSHGCIAVNYWYDMEFDIKYNYYKFVEDIVEGLKEGCAS